MKNCRKYLNSSYVVTVVLLLYYTLYKIANALLRMMTVNSTSFSVWSSPFAPSTTSCSSLFYFSSCLLPSASSCSRSVAKHSSRPNLTHSVAYTVFHKKDLL